MIEGRMPISWSAIQALHEPELERHWVRCRDELGLDCPLEVFEELFFEHHGDEDFGTMYRAADWSAVVWTELELSGVALRRVGVDRGYQYAVDEARARTLEEGLSDARDAVVEHWARHLTWLRPPILVSGGERSRPCDETQCLVARRERRDIDVPAGTPRSMESAA
jgi:hypothetical protein